MEATTANPRKRRRKFVALLLLTVASVTWWNWPRGDARFVGTWKQNDQWGNPFGSVLTLNRNGTGGRPGVWIPWRTSGNQVTLGTTLPLWLQIRFRPWEVWLRATLSMGLAHPERRYKFRFVTPDQVRLFPEGPEGGGWLEFTRVRE